MHAADRCWPVTQKGCRSLKQDAHTDIAAPEVLEVWQVGILPRHFDSKCDALIFTRRVEGAAQAAADGGGANQGKLDDGRIVQAADPADAETAGREGQGRAG